MVQTSFRVHRRGVQATPSEKFSELVVVVECDWALVELGNAIIITGAGGEVSTTHFAQQNSEGGRGPPAPTQHGQEGLLADGADI